MRDCTENQSDNKPDIKLDLKPVIKKSGGSSSSHSYGIPSGAFTEKAQNATKKKMNIKLCDPEGRIWKYQVWNTDPIYESVIRPYVKEANFDIRVSTTEI